MRLLAFNNPDPGIITINEVTSMAHTKSGMRSSVMPGARSFRMVVISTIEVTRPGISVKVMSCAQKSARLPGENSGPDSGG